MSGAGFSEGERQGFGHVPIGEVALGVVTCPQDGTMGLVEAIEGDAHLDRGQEPCEETERGWVPDISDSLATRW